MSYRCAIGRGLEVYGMEPGPARFTCDACGLVVSVEGKDGLPHLWFINKYPAKPPGWKAYPRSEFTAWHHCKVCKTTKAPPAPLPERDMTHRHPKATAAAQGAKRRQG